MNYMLCYWNLNCKFKDELEYELYVTWNMNYMSYVIMKLVFIFWCVMMELWLYCRWRMSLLFKNVHENSPGFLSGSVVKNPPAMQETQVLSLGQEDSPEERSGNPLYYSCLENFKDRGAWQTTVQVKSLTRVQLFVTPWTVAYHNPPSTGFSRQEYWSGLPLRGHKSWTQLSE